RKSAQRRLHSIAELAKNLVRDVDRILSDEIDSDSLGANEPYDELHFFQEGRRRVGEQEVSLVEEEHELRLVGISGFRQLLEQLGQHPKQETGVEARIVHQSVGRQHVDHPTAVDGLNQVVDVEHRLTEEALASLL